MLGIVETLKFFWAYYDSRSLHAALEMARTALELDPDEAYGHLAAGFASLYLRQYGQAELSLERAVALNPNDPFILTIHAGLNEAQRRDPFAIGWYEDFRGMALTTAGRYREAIASYARVPNIPSWSVVRLAICHSELGEIDQAQADWAKVKASWPGLDTDEIAEDLLDYYDDPAVCGRYRAILQRLDKQI
jgi:tetratricopeptide (TPR) repeat protein